MSATGLLQVLETIVSAVRTSRWLCVTVLHYSSSKTSDDIQSRIYRSKQKGDDRDATHTRDNEIGGHV